MDKLPLLPYVGLALALLVWPCFMLGLATVLGHPSPEDHENNKAWYTLAPSFLWTFGLVSLTLSSWISGLVMGYSRRLAIAIAILNLAFLGFFAAVFFT